MSFIGPVPQQSECPPTRSGSANGVDPYGPYRLVGTTLGIVTLIVAATELVLNAMQPEKTDFLAFWGAGRLALEGTPTIAYDATALHQLQASVAQLDGAELPFRNPPAFLLLVMPFALLPYTAALAAWTSATFAAYFLAVRRMFPDSGWLGAAFPPIFVNAVIGQNAFLTAALFIGGLMLLQRRPFVGGLLLGCLILKPQLGLLLPIALLAARQWRAIAGAASSVLGVLLIGAALFGTAATALWIQQFPTYASTAIDGLTGWEKLGSLYAAARQAGLNGAAAYVIHGAVALAAAFATWRVWSSHADWPCKMGVLCASTLLISPYIFLPDTLILVVPLLWLARWSERPALVAILWCLPIVSILQMIGSAGPINLIPWISVAVLTLLWRKFSGQQSLHLPRGLAPTG